MNRWEQFNTLIDDETLTKDEKALALVIFRYINHETGFCTASTETLMNKSRIGNRNTFNKARFGLVNAGYLQYNSVRGKGTIYQLTFRSEHTELNTPRSEVVNEMYQNCTIKRNKKENRTEMINNNKYHVLEMIQSKDNQYYDYLHNYGWMYSEMSTEFIC